jgi:NAD(P)-dependent dehydrogenase (short-subunit alcohol dehydrogenase family)
MHARHAADFSVSDRVIIITGAGAGIGRSMALGLGEAGANIACVDLDEAQAAAVAEEIGGERAMAVRCDVSSETDVKAAVAAVLSRWGRIDGLINNAGRLIRSPVKDHTLEGWNSVFSVNVVGTFLFAREVLPHMAHRRHGRIVNFTSALGVRSTPGAAAYGAAKAAIASFTNTLHQEVAGSGITVSAIAPGLTDTAMSSGHLSRDYIERIAASYPGGRLGQPEDIVGLAHFLMSPAAEHVSGSTLFVRPPGG